MSTGHRAHRPSLFTFSSAHSAFRSLLDQTVISVQAEVCAIVLRGKTLSAEMFVNNRRKHAVQKYFTRRRDSRRHFGEWFRLFGCAAGYEEHARNEDE